MKVENPKHLFILWATVGAAPPRPNSYSSSEKTTDNPCCASRLQLFPLTLYRHNG